MRILVVGWSSIEDGEATAGDVMAMDAVSSGLRRSGIDHDVAWSAVMCPPGGLHLSDADPKNYSHLIFVCGPIAGAPILELTRRFRGCVRIAIGVSVVDPHRPELSEFHHVLFRDRPGCAGRSDLAASVTTTGTPVIGVILTQGQREYGERRRHEWAYSTLTSWLNTLTDYVLVPIDTRLDPRDWRLGTAPAHLESLICRLDAVITMRLHGLVLALKNGVPAIAIDPVSGGAKVAAQAEAWRWPAVLTAERLSPLRLTDSLNWCLSGPGQQAAQNTRPVPGPYEQIDELTALLLGTRNGSPAAAARHSTSAAPAWER